jgi:hypothetical protein
MAIYQRQYKTSFNSPFEEASNKLKSLHLQIFFLMKEEAVRQVITWRVQVLEGRLNVREAISREKGISEYLKRCGIRPGEIPSWGDIAERMRLKNPDMYIPKSMRFVSNDGGYVLIHLTTKYKHCKRKGTQTKAWYALPEDTDPLLAEILDGGDPDIHLSIEEIESIREV